MGVMRFRLTSMRLLAGTNVKVKGDVELLISLTNVNSVQEKGR